MLFDAKDKALPAEKELNMTHHGYGPFQAFKPLQGHFGVKLYNIQFSGPLFKL